jgi:hypothetical protein
MSSGHVSAIADRTMGSCTQAMRTFLATHVSWEHRHEKSGDRVLKRTSFALMSDNIKQAPQTLHTSAADGALPDGVYSVRRVDFRGKEGAATYADVTNIMRQTETQLPYWRSVTVHNSVPKMLDTLQRWLGAGLQLPGEALAPVVSAPRHLTYLRHCRAGRASHDVEMEGLEMTCRALGLDPDSRAGGRYRTRSVSTTGDPRFLMCNGQTGAGGKQCCTWAKAQQCKAVACGLRLPDRDGSAGELYSREQLQKRCGVDGRAARLQVCRDQQRK